MDFEATLRSLSALADASTRRATLDALAHELGACAVRLAIREIEHAARFTPPPGAPGWPDSSGWNDLLERCRQPGTHAGTLTSPGEGMPAPAVAYATPALAMIVVGHTRSSDPLAAAFDVAAPLLAALLRAEQQAATTRDQVLARIGQELRDPIAPIANALQLLRLEATQTRVHDILERQVTRLLRLVDDLIAESTQRTPTRSPGALATRGPAASTSYRASVLVVDDNRDAADLLATLLGSLGYEVRVAHTGPDGLALLDEVTPDIGLLDIGLPGMDGYDLARALHARLPALPLVAITGYGQDRDRERAFEAGFAAHLVKPVSIASLSDVLGELLDRAR